MAAALGPIDPASNPYLNGVFAPVDDEFDVADLPVIGNIPEDMRGAYLRNGPNVKFPPLGSYTYPLDGDGMIHGVWLTDGRARYRNRYVLTKGLKAEIDLTTMESSFIILDAEDFSGEPAAVVKLPRRTPLGLHGNWFPAES